MENIINKYKDEYGYIEDLESLYNEIKNILDIKEVKDIIFNIIKSNEEIINKLKSENIELEKYNRTYKILETNYELKESNKETIDNYSIDLKENVNIDFYVYYIEKNLENNEYISILPKKLDNDGLTIIYNLLVYYLKLIKEIDINLCEELTQEEINFWLSEKDKYLKIFKRIKLYKDNYKYITEEEQKNIENEIVYYLNNGEPYIISDIKNDPDSYESIDNLIQSIKDGIFKKVRLIHTEYKDLRLYEVRDLSMQTRIIFERVGLNKYCVILALVNKKEANKYIFEKIKNRYKKYRTEKSNYDFSDKVKKLLKGE